MTYEQALEYLSSLGKFGINLGLERIKKLLELMGNPENRFRKLHVTGTNGKGSTTVMLASILTAAGIKTGMYTSPHLIDYTERIAIDGCPVTKQAFAGSIAFTSRFVAQMAAAGWEHPTEFEVLTAAAFYCFAENGVEYAVIEVGLGGLLDSTNVILPEVAVITNVTLEHTDRCGNTITEIACHKAGIIKSHIPVVTAAKGEALEIIARTAHEKSAPLYVFGRDFCGVPEGIGEGRQIIGFKIPAGEYYERFAINLMGRHQAENAAVSIQTARVLANTERRITPEAIRAGLSWAIWPGRFEVVDGNPVIVIDGAHNPDGARVLRTALDEIFPGKRICFVLGILRDKDIAGIIANLITKEDKVVVVAPPSDRAAQPTELVQKICASQTAIAGTIAEGIMLAQNWAQTSGVVCIAGSLYLVGTARKILGMNNSKEYARR